MKKTILAAAIAAACAAPAFAADVTVYGVIDTGLLYEHNKLTMANASEKADELSMSSGMNSANRFGLKGSEDLGNGLKVGFVLENGFNADDGSFKTDGKLFDRESSLSLSGGFGTVYFGRMGALVSDTGSVGFFGAAASALGSGWTDNITGHTAVFADYVARRDNMITYVTPEFAGARVYAQYAMGDNGSENKPSTDRYAAIGAAWQQGAFSVNGLVDWTNKNSSRIGSDSIKFDADIEDAWTFSLAGAYDCGFAKTTIALQYFKDSADAAGILTEVFEGKEFTRIYSVDGYGVHLGTSFGLAGGTLMAGIGYMDGTVNDNRTNTLMSEVADIQAYAATIAYEYPFSKRTKLYTGMGYRDRELDYKGTIPAIEMKGYDFALGLAHSF